MSKLRVSGNQTDAQRILIADAAPAFTEWLRRINQLIDFEEAKNKSLGGKAQAAASGFLLMTLILAVAALALAVAFASLRSLRPLTILTDLMGRVAKDDISEAVPYTDRRDEVGAIARAVQLFKESCVRRLALESESRQFQSEFDMRLQETTLAFEGASQAGDRVSTAVKEMSSNIRRKRDAN